MKFKALENNTLLCIGENQKELSLTFFRIQEFYESQKPELRDQKFDVFNFLDVMMNEYGELTYFADWSGFNFPDYVYEEWWNTHATGKFTEYETQLIREIAEKLDEKQKFYVIGVMEDDLETFNHEMAHALYYLNDEYNLEMTGLNLEFAINHPESYNNLSAELRELGYADSVMLDEIQAYMCSSGGWELKSDFGVNTAEAKKIIAKYRKLLRKYNTFTMDA